MDESTKEKIQSIIAELETESGSISPRDAEYKYMEVLAPLLNEEGYELNHTGGQNDNGIDAVGILPESANTKELRLGIQFKYYKSARPTSLATIREVIGAGLISDLERIILVSNTKFSASAREMITHDLPLDIELMDLDSLRAWLSRIVEDKIDVEEEVRILIESISSRLAEIIAKKPDALNCIEWRDLERLIAEVFSGLGFEAQLTPASKDGGKDVILSCKVSNDIRSYIVEIKHWRSGVRVGHKAIGEFLHVIGRENRDGGLYLSTHGYCDNAFESLTEFDRRKLKFGNDEKVVSLCKNYVKAKAGIWSPPQKIEEVIFEGTT